MRTDFSKMKSFMDKYSNKMTEDELKKESNRLYEQRVENEKRLVELYDAKKLTNPDTIRKAKSIKAKRASKKID